MVNDGFKYSEGEHFSNLPILSVQQLDNPTVPYLFLQFTALCIWGVGRIKKTFLCCDNPIGKWDDWVGSQPPLDWRENLQETIDFPIKYGFFRCANSPKPIHWNHQAVLDFPNLVGILESLGQRPLSEFSTGCAGWVAEEPLTRTLAVRRCFVFLCGDFLAKCWSISIQLFFLFENHWLISLFSRKIEILPAGNEDVNGKPAISIGKWSKFGASWALPFGNPLCYGQLPFIDDLLIKIGDFLNRQEGNPNPAILGCGTLVNTK